MEIFKKSVKNFFALAGLEISKTGPQFKNLSTKESLFVNAVSREVAPLRVHIFWAYGALTKLEIISIVSFLRNGYEVNFWSYGEITNVPSGVLLRNAREIFLESEVFTYKNGSYAAFSNLFRYAVLMKEGGLWADADVVCLLPAEIIQNSSVDEFYVTERTHDNNIVALNTNVIYMRNPVKGSIVDLAYGVTKNFDIDRLNWGSCGPKLFTVLAKTYPELVSVLMAPDFANPVDWQNCPNQLFQPCSDIPSNWAFLHCYNETWRRSGFDKNQNYLKGSLMNLIEKKVLRE